MCLSCNQVLRIRGFRSARCVRRPSERVRMRTGSYSMILYHVFIFNARGGGKFFSEKQKKKARIRTRLLATLPGAAESAGTNGGLTAQTRGEQTHVPSARLRLRGHAAVSFVKERKRSEKALRSFLPLIIALRRTQEASGTGLLGITAPRGAVPRLWTPPLPQVQPPFWL